MYYSVLQFVFIKLLLRSNSRARVRFLEPFLECVIKFLATLEIVTEPVGGDRSGFPVLLLD